MEANILQVDFVVGNEPKREKQGRGWMLTQSGSF